MTRRGRFQSAATALLGVAALLLAGCGGGTATESQPEKVERARDRGSPSSTVSADDYSRARFDAGSADVDHRWYPLRPGTRLIYRGSSLEDGERLQHGVDIIVTDLTKVVEGVRNVVVWERDYTEGELVETELALFAQDTEGHIWHMGEYPEEWEEGEFVTAPAWVHGIAGAYAGVTIPAEPREGTPGYEQGYAPPPINWVDHGRVYKTGQRTCVPADCYTDVVVIEEFEPTIDDAYQDKFYAPDVGVVRVGWRGANDESKEVLELVKTYRLSKEDLATYRAEALALEERAYRISPQVFARTERAEPPD